MAKMAAQIVCAFVSSGYICMTCALILLLLLLLWPGPLRPIAARVMQRRMMAATGTRNAEGFPLDRTAARAATQAVVSAPCLQVSRRILGQALGDGLGQGGGGSPLRGCTRKKLSSVGPERPSGSSGGMKRSFTNEYIRTRSSTTFLNSELSCTRSR
uniref:Uncharacterized protein n=1 Tax=Anopheles atroparvus TaxID=41427 RepID=A0A182JL39_ANOAO